MSSEKQRRDAAIEAGDILHAGLFDAKLETATTAVMEMLSLCRESMSVSKSVSREMKKKLGARPRASSSRLAHARQHHQLCIYDNTTSSVRCPPLFPNSETDLLPSRAPAPRGPRAPAQASCSRSWA